MLLSLYTSVSWVFFLSQLYNNDGGAHAISFFALILRVRGGHIITGILVYLIEHWDFISCVTVLFQLFTYLTEWVIKMDPIYVLSAYFPLWSISAEVECVWYLRYCNVRIFDWRLALAHSLFSNCLSWLSSYFF